MNWYWRQLVKSGQHTNHTRTQWRKVKQKLGISYNNILQQLGRGKIFALSPFWSFPLFPPFRLLDLTLRWAAQQYDGNIDSSTKWYFPLVFQEPKSPHNIFHITPLGKSRSTYKPAVTAVITPWLPLWPAAVARRWVLGVSWSQRYLRPITYYDKVCT